MRIAFDLDGTLDRPAVTELAKALLAARHEVHIITGVFDESGEWQAERAKRDKLTRLGIFHVMDDLGDASYPQQQPAVLHVLHAVPETFSRDYRLADMGLRKGALCEKLGVTVMIDDSEDYCKMIPKMSGGTTVLRVM